MEWRAVEAEWTEFTPTQLPIQLLQMLGQTTNQVSKRHGLFIAGSFEDLGYTLGDIDDPLGNNQAKLAQQSADLIGLGGTGLHKALAHPMHREDRLLFDILDRYEAHVWSAHRFAEMRPWVGNMRR
jgi:hypothetical protein